MAARIKANQKYETLGEGLIGFVDQFNGEGGQAMHEIHVYDHATGTEVGVYREGRFFDKHGTNPVDIKLDSKVMERLNGVDVAKLRAEGRVNIVNQVKATKPWRTFTRIPIVGVGVGLVPFAVDPTYTWRNYAEDAVCGAMGGCGEAH